MIVTHLATRLTLVKLPSVSGRLADELRVEQDHGMSANKACKSLHAQSVELAGMLDETEDQALRHGKKVIAKLEERVRAMESELGMY
jgi:myosin heavy chain 6/7